MKKIALSLASAFIFMGCSAQQTEMLSKEGLTTSSSTQIVSKVQTPDWAKDAVIYQVNIRQYSEAGTFAAVEADLNRIKDLGVDILWFMPIHPIGEEKRKGSMGSPYAVKDFRAVNTDLGSLDDFKSLIETAHALDMKVIIDWVANHTAWDNHLIMDHPEWYTRDKNGDMQHPEGTDWVDVADLDYTQQGLRNYMKEALLYWVRDVGIDGFRCDVAGMVPTDFWNDVRPALDAVKPVFMLAEWQEQELHEEAFDASYAWEWKEVLQDIVKEKADALDMKTYYTDYQNNWPEGAMRMAYTSNHDQNTWDGLPQDIYGEAYDAAMALSFVGSGIPLIYNGQEAGNTKRLEFFEKDLIVWNFDHPNNDFFKKLVSFKTEYEALHNGLWGGDMVFLETDKPEHILSFIREKNGVHILSLFNLSSEVQTFSLMNEELQGRYSLELGQESEDLTFSDELSLAPWAYQIFVQSNDN